MPPEQLGGAANVGHKGDLYALGAVLYELLTGTLPLGRFPVPSETKGVPRALDAIVLRCLDRDPEARFRTADELREALETAREALYPRATLRSFGGAGAVARGVVGATLRSLRVAANSEAGRGLLLRAAVVAGVAQLVGLLLPFEHFRPAWFAMPYDLPVPVAFPMIAILAVGALAVVVRQRGLTARKLTTLRVLSLYAFAHILVAAPAAGPNIGVGWFPLVLLAGYLLWATRRLTLA
jgi:hypothetical protein